MHRNRFQGGKREFRSVRRVVSTVAVFLCAVAILLYGVRTVGGSARESQAESLKQAIERSAVHCYAMEGRYPESLDDIKENYGIRWDERKYAVDYEILGSNLKPGVTVIPLKQQGGGR